MSVEMKLGLWRARNGQLALVVQHAPGMTFPWRACGGGCWTDGGGHFETKPSPYDLVEYLGPIPISPTPACADQAGTPVVSTVSTETAGEQLRRMRERYNAMDREASIYSGLLAALDQAKSDLGERIRAMEKGHDL